MSLSCRRRRQKQAGSGGPNMAATSHLLLLLATVATAMPAPANKGQPQPQKGGSKGRGQLDKFVVVLVPEASSGDGRLDINDVVKKARSAAEMAQQSQQQKKGLEEPLGSRVYFSDQGLDATDATDVEDATDENEMTESQTTDKALMEVPIEKKKKTAQKVKTETKVKTAAEDLQLASPKPPRKETVDLDDLDPCPPGRERAADGECIEIWSLQQFHKLQVPPF